MDGAEEQVVSRLLGWVSRLSPTAFVLLITALVAIVNTALGRYLSVVIMLVSVGLAIGVAYLMVWLVRWVQR